MVRSRTWDDDYNLLVYFLLAIALAGSLFLAWKDVSAGVIYSLMIVGVTALVFLAVNVFLKDTERDVPVLSKFMKVPFSTSTGVSAFFLLLGFGIPFLIQGFIRLIGGSFSVTSFSIPLFGNQVNQAFQSFATAEVGNSMSWRLFTTVFTAGVGETYVFSFGTMVVGILMGLFLWTMLTDRERLLGLSKRGFVLGFALLLSVGFFIASHLLNSTYAGRMFLFAGLFLLVSNISIYLGGVFLSGWIGYHASNNLIWMFEEFGFQSVFVDGLLSWFGLFLMAFLILLIVYVVRKWDVIRVELRDFRKYMSG